VPEDLKLEGQAYAGAPCPSDGVVSQSDAYVVSVCHVLLGGIDYALPENGTVQGIVSRLDTAICRRGLLT
jgi:hypothetical protein